MKNLKRGDRIYLGGREGLVFSSDGEITELIINGDLISVNTQDPSLSSISLTLPSAASIVLDDNQGEEGNSFYIMGRVVSYAKKLKSTHKQIQNYYQLAMSSDYDNLLLVSIKFLQTLGLV